MKLAGKPLTRASLKTFAFVLLLIIGFAVLSQFVGILGQGLYAIVAALFYFVPNKLIEKDEENYEEYGLVFGNWKKGIVWGLSATVVTFPFFVAGFWIWEVKVRGKTFNFESDKYRQWEANLEGKPKTWGDRSGVWIWSDNEKLSVGIRNKKTANNRVTLLSDQPFSIEKNGAVVSKKHDGGKRWTLGLSHHDSRGSVVIANAQRLKITVAPITEGKPQWPMYTGPTASSTDSFSEKRGYLWLLLWAATQFLLVAFPEEYFYRGYLQSRFTKAFKSKDTLRRWWIFTPSIVLTSFLFGIGHLLVPVGGVLIVTRITVFFPSLLFGWLRDKTDSILAPVIYHACCNLMVLVTALHFG